MNPLSTKTRTLLLVGLLAALPLAGCIENMQDLKERLGADEKGEATTPASTTDGNVTTPAAPVKNATKNATKPPVARITIFGEAGALIYKSSFEAADPAEPLFVKAPVKLQLLASDSEALEPGATLAQYSWLFAGMAMTGSKVEHELTDPGMYNLSLTITDSKNMTDQHNVTIAVTPEPFEVVEEVRTSPVIGAGGVPVSGTATWTLSFTREDKLHTVSGLTFTTMGGAACDPILTVTAPDGTVVGPQDSGSQETITFATPAEGDYAITADGFACVAADGLLIEVRATFVQVVEGVEAGDGHGGHAH